MYTHTHMHAVGQPTFSIERDVPSALRPHPTPTTSTPAPTSTDAAEADADMAEGISVVRFDGTIEACRDWLHAHGVRLLGIEIGEAGAADVDTEPFDGPTALMLGNEVGGWIWYR